MSLRVERARSAFGRTAAERLGVLLLCAAGAWSSAAIAFAQPSPMEKPTPAQPPPAAPGGEPPAAEPPAAEPSPAPATDPATDPATEPPPAEEAPAPEDGATPPAEEAPTAAAAGVQPEPVAQPAPTPQPAPTVAPAPPPAAPAARADAAPSEAAVPQEPEANEPSREPTRFVVGLGLQAALLHDRGYERFGSQSQVQFHALLGYDALRVAEVFALGVEVHTEQGRQVGGTGAGGVDGELTTQSYMAALVPRFEAAPWLWPHARIGVGGVRSKLSLDPAEGASLREHDWGVAVDLAAGLSFVVPRESSRRQRSLRVAPLVRLEAGYRFAQDATFGAAQSESGGVPVQRPSLGSLNRGAALLRVLVALRF